MYLIHYFEQIDAIRMSKDPVYRNWEYKVLKLSYKVLEMWK